MVTVRSFDPSVDISRLLRFFNALELLEGDPNPSTEDHVRSQMHWRGHDPAQDRWVIEHPHDPSAILGHAWIFKQTSKRAACKVAIHSDWQHQGLGSVLLSRVLLRAQEIGMEEVVSGCDSSDQAAQGFLNHHGFQVRSSNWFLMLPATVPISSPIWPSAYTVRRYVDVDHLPTLAAVLNRSFHDLPGHAENEVGVITVESVQERLGKTLIPEDLFLVFAVPDILVGICGLRRHGRSENASGIDILDQPGIVPDYREQNLHIPLVLTAVHWQRQHSDRDLMLECYGDSEARIASYEALGFRLQSRFMEYGRGV
jgi:GNAT superfamily N-acetyltransferase